MFWRRNHKERVIFLHIPKTGGMTLNSILEKEYDPGEIYSFDLNSNKIAGSIEQFRKTGAGDRKRIKLLKGHMDFGLHREFPGKTTYITMLREPVARVISNYYFVKSDITHPAHEFFKDKSLTEVVTLPENRFNNGQVAMIAGSHFVSTLRTADTLEKAKKNIESYFSLVGLTEKFDESIVLMKKRFGWKISGYTRKNVTGNKPARESISRDVFDVIMEYNTFDLELYRYAEALFEKEVLQYGRNFTRDVQRFKEKNMEMNLPV